MKLQEITENIAKRLSITELTPVQRRMAGLAGTPAIRLIAPTGSGKTIAFTLTMLLSAGAATGVAGAVVIVPSRELARQVAGVVTAAAAGVLRVVACYGGHSFDDERNSLSAGADIIVATPGRLLDHIRRRTFDYTAVATIVLDEYDKSLELGFESEMKRILHALPSPRTLIMTSATEALEIPAFIPRRKVTTIAPERDAAPLPDVDVVKVTSYTRDKLATATDLALHLGLGPAIIFVNHRESAERVGSHFRKLGFPVGVYHGGLDQTDRENALEMFANGSTPLLVSTDLGARGLDISGVADVVHYNLPVTAEVWTHRNGRTARMGAKGRVWVIVSEDEGIPEYVEWDRTWQPAATADDSETKPLRAPWATLLLSLGKREKISKGDVVGFLTANTGLSGSEIGRICVRDHTTLVAVANEKAAGARDLANKAKIKNQRVKVTLL